MSRTEVCTHQYPALWAFMGNVKCTYVQCVLITCHTLMERCSHAKACVQRPNPHERCCAGIIAPALPEKNVVQKYQMTTEFIEIRRRALSVYLNKVVRIILPAASASLSLPL